MTTRGPPLHAHHHNTRNPWGGPASSSSGSSRTYHCPAEYSQPARTPSPHYDVIEGPRLNRLGMTPSERAITPTSTCHTHHLEADTAVDPCGGHCTAFENFCHYCLQVLFIAGILTGISLCIAGSVLRNQKRGGDLLVLVYIGCLTALVCTLLLSVQCCVRRNVQRRKRARRLPPHHQHQIPMQPLGPTVPGHPGGYEPLLRRLLQQQIQEDQRYIPPEPLPLPVPLQLQDSLIRGDRSGTPWWRRQQPLPGKVAHSHVQMPL